MHPKENKMIMECDKKLPYLASFNFLQNKKNNNNFFSFDFLFLFHSFPLPIDSCDFMAHASCACVWGDTICAEVANLFGSIDS